MVVPGHLLDFWGEPLPTRTCTTGTARYLFPWASATFSPDMHQHLRICCSSRRNSAGSCRVSTAAEDVEHNGPDAAGMSFGSDGTGSIDAPQSSHLDTEPHRCALRTSGASCACSGIATSGMAPHSSVSASGLSGTAPGIAAVGCGHKSTFGHFGIFRKAGSCCFQLRFCH
jgi:hypothetical protein